MGAPTPISSESSRTAHCPDSVKVAVGGGCTRSRHGEEIGLSDDGTRSDLQHASRRPQAPGPRPGPRATSDGAFPLAGRPYP